MRLFTDTDEPDVRFTHDREILAGIRNRPSNSVIYYIGNYPSDEIIDRIDFYLRNLKPPNEYWDDVLSTGNPRERGSGWASTGFESKYMLHMKEHDDAYAEAMHTRARALVRPVYIGHHPEDEMYSPARVCINFIKEGVQLPSEVDHEMVTTYDG